MLLLTKQDMVYKDYEAKISASGTTICAIDATAVFEPYPDQKNSLARNGIRRLQDVRVLSLGSKYSARVNTTLRAENGGAHEVLARKNSMIGPLSGSRLG